MNKINFLEKKNVTYIIIAIFIVFALIHLYKINSNTTEPFATIGENSNVANGVVIDIPLLTQVRFGGTGLNALLDNKADASSLLDKATVSDLGVATTAANNALAAANNALATANNAMPELSIIAYGGNTIPPGWQLCNGEVLRYYKSTPSVPLFMDNVMVTTSDARFNNLSKQTITDFGDYYSTPDLRGRFILGAGQGKVLQKDKDGNVIAIKDAANLEISLTNRGIKDVGGKETHILSEAEMPRHNHTNNIISTSSSKAWSGALTGDLLRGQQYDRQYLPSTMINPTGGNAPHENMPPFYVLTYIIKQPIKV